MPKTVSQAAGHRVREAFANRCSYCLGSQNYVYGILKIEHILPKSRGGTNEKTNLCLACRNCNLYKSDQIEAFDQLTQQLVPLFNPRTAQWPDHFCFARDSAEIIGRTAIGRATVIALQLNNIISLTVRREWVRVGWYPPQDVA